MNYSPNTEFDLLTFSEPNDQTNEYPVSASAVRISDHDDEEIYDVLYDGMVCLNEKLVHRNLNRHLKADDVFKHLMDFGYFSVAYEQTALVNGKRLQRYSIWIKTKFNPT